MLQRVSWQSTCCVEPTHGLWDQRGSSQPAGHGSSRKETAVSRASRGYRPIAAAPRATAYFSTGIGDFHRARSTNEVASNMSSDTNHV
jgi:hypothetical protein